ncbi:hypothetical protein PR048_030516 [Dryococelus australis]|uniref:Uncharacterized protein n=1 Tax=Dryococelus australis TaxID=614101 RepID=A0ABQ9G978_9NEOP|nr:hypothetical protein PR048_030516 [Dryococelus australis]
MVGLVPFEALREKDLKGKYSRLSGSRAETTVSFLYSFLTNFGSPLVDNRPIMNAVKYRVMFGVVWTNRTMVSSNTATNRTGVLAEADPAHLPPKRTGFNPRSGHRIFACGNRAGRCHWSADFFGDLPFPPHFRSSIAPYSPKSPSSALKTSLDSSDFSKGRFMIERNSPSLAAWTLLPGPPLSQITLVLVFRTLDVSTHSLAEFHSCCNSKRCGVKKRRQSHVTAPTKRGNERDGRMGGYKKRFYSAAPSHSVTRDGRPLVFAVVSNSAASSTPHSWSDLPAGQTSAALVCLPKSYTDAIPSLSSQSDMRVLGEVLALCPPKRYHHKQWPITAYLRRGGRTRKPTTLNLPEVGERVDDQFPRNEMDNRLQLARTGDTSSCESESGKLPHDEKRGRLTVIGGPARGRRRAWYAAKRGALLFDATLLRLFREKHPSLGTVRSSLRSRYAVSFSFRTALSRPVAARRGTTATAHALTSVIGTSCEPTRPERVQRTCFATLGRGGLTVSSLASHQGEPGSIPGRVTGFSHVGFVPVDAVGRRVFSRISRFPSPFIPAHLHTPTSALKTPLLRAA